MYDSEFIGVILGIFFLWGCFKLYEEYLWFRVVAATYGIGLTLIVPMPSSYAQIYLHNNPYLFLSKFPYNLSAISFKRVIFVLSFALGLRISSAVL